MILKAKKTNEKLKKITISTSIDSNSFTETNEFKVPYNIIVSGEDKYVYLVTNRDELKVLEKLSVFDNTLPDLGLKMKTGLTVNYRNKDYLVDDYEENSVPLFYPQHIKNGKVEFPIGREEEFILKKRPRLLQNNSNYLFVKRFTSKEEPRRLQSAVYLARKYPELDTISTQNKLNFITGLKDLSECVVFGLYVIFNSTLYDQYYRILNGSTQVNSTEINSMPVPSMESIENMGNELISVRNMSVETCDGILARYI
ncbi:MAG: hypothetical protein ACOX2O_05140 [Bdellovibrionota bacterium]|jgi:adenine-specific DNA-methyltransferase